MVVHALPSPVTIEQATPAAKAAKANSATDAYWVGAWIQLDEKGNVTRICCEWEGKDIKSIGRVFDKILKVIDRFPVDGIYQMMKVDAEVYG